MKIISIESKYVFKLIKPFGFKFMLPKGVNKAQFLRAFDFISAEIHQIPLFLGFTLRRVFAVYAMAGSFCLMPPPCTAATVV